MLERERQNVGVSIAGAAGRWTTPGRLLMGSRQLSAQQIPATFVPVYDVEGAADIEHTRAWSIAP